MIVLENVSKTYSTRTSSVEAVRDVSLHVERGEIIGIIGFSGAGKSTLVRLINLLEKPTSGKVFVAGREMTSMARGELLEARRSIGMIFQSFNLLMQRTALENVVFPLSIARRGRREAKARAKELLEMVGLPEKEKSYPSQLSGGQRQRVAIARALATDPQVLLCDEATSALDPTTTDSILRLISQINRQTGITVVMITHQLSVARQICQRSAIMASSRIVESGPTESLFRNPQSDGAKKLLLSHAADGEGATLHLKLGTEEKARLFVGELAVTAGLPVSVFYEGGGQLLLNPQEGSLARVKEFLDARRLDYQEG